MALDEIIYLGGLAALEEAEVRAENVRKFHIHDDPFDESDNKFVKLYRLTKDMTSHLIDMVTPQMEHPSRLSALTIERKVSLVYNISFK